jgi:hypothetical protein
MAWHGVPMLAAALAGSVPIPISAIGGEIGKAGHLAMDL